MSCWRTDIDAMSTHDGATTALSRIPQRALLNNCARRCAICHKRINLGEIIRLNRSKNGFHRGSSLPQCPQIYGDEIGRLRTRRPLPSSELLSLRALYCRLTSLRVSVPVFEASRLNERTAQIESRLNRALVAIVMLKREQKRPSSIDRNQELATACQHEKVAPPRNYGRCERCNQYLAGKPQRLYGHRRQ